MAYFLGIDAGGSHCRSRLADDTGRILGAAEGGPANTRVGVELVHARISEIAQAAIAQAGLDEGAAASIRAGMGIAGIGRTGVREALEALPFPFASVSYATDAAIANLGSHLGKDGATLIIGTGSVAMVNAGGRSFTIGGYGFPISDEGSGAALGLSAVRHALRALDGRTEPTALSRAITADFAHDTAQVVAWMDAAAPGDYAAFAPLVMDYAENGDTIARSIVEDAASHIERFIETIFARGAERCALSGGLSSRIRPWLRARTSEMLTAPQADPLDGALLLAGIPASAVPTRR
ncbi:BadF/BadG/BcrA/BcrD ATPase family protein [Sphingomonas soli]|uniref:BadF/BadG/BcrA/BcrD ATPase family protein n=1 Tax=Sphingomonas soli TaxID=266127 RepID=UPI00082C2969|nr:BadF/BadG/BcrA/BcrD ATPase family protein [Sphingomonas soli]